MSVEVYLGKRFDYSHERRALGRFLKNMYDCFEGNDELYFVVVEPQANRANIDLLLVSSSAIVIIEFKQLTQAEESERHQVHLLGKQNDVWNYHLPSGRTFNLGSPTKTRNPYRQTRDMRFELAKWIKDHARSFLGMQWSEHRTLNHVHAWVVVSPGFDGDMSDLDLPADDMEFGNSSYKWFQVIGIEDLAAEFDCAPDTDLNLSEVQMRGLIDELGVTRCANMQELMPGYIALAPLFSKPPEMKALVNRDAQRAELLEAVNNKHMSVILIEGIAGVGRTALAAWLVGEVNQRGYRVRWVDCREKTGTTLDSILTAISAEVTDLKRGLIRNPDQPSIDRQDAALEFLDKRPTLLIFDDYHLLVNRQVINQFIARASRHRECLRILITSRERVIDSAWQSDAICEVEIGGLSLETFTEFASTTVHHAGLRADEIKLIWERCSGNPQVFLLSQPLIRQYALMGKLPELPIADSDAWFQSLLENLSPAAQDLAQRLSVVRNRLSFQMICSLSKMTPDKASILTMELEDKYVLKRVDSEGNFTMVEFIRTFLYAQMTDKLRRAAHQQTGEYLSRLADVALDELQGIVYLEETIHHFEQAGARKQLLDRAVVTYTLLMKVGDRDRAQAIAETALVAAKAEQDRESICSWLLKIAGLELYREQRDDTDQFLAQAVSYLPKSTKKMSIQQTLRWKEIETEIWILRGRSAYYAANYTLAADNFQKGLGLARELGNGHAEATCLTWLGRIERQRGRHHEAVARFREALAISEQIADKKLICDGLGHLGLIERSHRKYEDAKWMFARAYEIALATNDPSSAEISLGHLGRNAMLSGDNVEAERIFRKTLQLAQELHNLRGIRVQLTNLTEALIRLGRYSEAESTLKESEKRNIEANDSIGLAWNLKHHGQIEKAQGRIETGNQYIQQGLDKLQKIDNKEYLSEFQAALRGEIQIPPESD